MTVRPKMKGTTHLVIGLSAGMAVSSALGIPPKTVPWFALLLGALAPDLDEEESTMANPSKFLGPLLPKTVCDLLDSIATAVSKLLKFAFGHRGFLHWPILAVLIMALGMRYNIYWLSWFGFGYLTHLASDACTMAGVPLFAPINHHSIQWSRLKTGGVGEKIIIIVCALYMVWWGYNQIPGESRETLKSRIVKVTEK